MTPTIATTDATDAKDTVTKEEMIRRAAELAPVLLERAPRAEELRQIPPETVADFRRLGFHRIAQPVRFGGLGLELDTAYEVAFELGRGCGSSAWMGAQWPLHNWMVGMWPESAQEEYWAGGFDALSSTSFNLTMAKAEPTAGGVWLSGRWDFSSGVDYADWVMISAMGPEGPAAHLVPKADYTIDDTWYVSGLCGSGSKDIVIERAFVPAHRILPYHLIGAAHTPGRALHDSPFYRAPLFSFFSYTLAAPVMGMAQGAVDLFEARERERVMVSDGARAAERPDLQMRLAEAAAAVDASLLLMRRDLAALIERVRGGEELSLDERARLRRDHGYTTKLCVQAVNRLFEASGAHALLLASPLQRLFRDINAASHSVALTWDPIFEQYGRVRLGLEPTTFLI